MERWQILRGVAEDEWSEPPCCDDGRHLALAQEAREKAKRPRLIVPPLHYIRRLEIHVSNHVPPDAREVSDGESIWYAAGRDPRDMGEDGYHGLAHVICERAKWHHNEADVWAVAAELILPAELALRCRSLTVAAKFQPHVRPDLLEAALYRAHRRELNFRVAYSQA